MRCNTLPNHAKPRNFRFGKFTKPALSLQMSFSCSSPLPFPSSLSLSAHVPFPPVSFEVGLAGGSLQRLFWCVLRTESCAGAAGDCAQFECAFLLNFQRSPTAGVVWLCLTGARASEGARSAPEPPERVLQARRPGDKDVPSKPMIMGSSR